MATEANQTVHTGNTVYLMVNNNVIGRAQSLRGERSYGTQGVYEIGSIMPAEHVYLRYEGTFNLERFRMKKESLEQLGLAALGEDILQRDIIDIVLMDNLTKQVITTYHGCSCVSMDESYSAGEIASENSSWTYLTAYSANSTSGRK